MTTKKQQIGFAPIFVIAIVAAVIVAAAISYFALRKSTVENPTQIEQNLPQAITRVAIPEQPSACNSAMSTFDQNQCMEKENDQLKDNLHTLYGKVNTVLTQYADPAQLEESQKQYREEYLANISKSLGDAEASANKYTASYCSALVEHYRLFGGTIWGLLYHDCERQALLDEQILLRKLFENNSDAKTSPQL